MKSFGIKGIAADLLRLDVKSVMLYLGEKKVRHSFYK